MLPADPSQALPSLVRACACFSSRSAARAITSLYDRILAPCGLRMPQLATVATLAFKGPLPMTQLAQILKLDASTLTRTLRPLREAEVIEVGADREGDRRQRRVALTDRGRAVALEAYGLWIEAQSELRRRVGSERFDRMLADMAHVARVCAE